VHTATPRSRASRQRGLRRPVPAARHRVLVKGRTADPLVVEVPAPVVADALGFHQHTTARHVAIVGGTWNRYAASRLPASADGSKP
jgi:hypothetical protein